MVKIEINNQTTTKFPNKKIVEILNMAQKAIKRKGMDNVSFAIVSPAAIKKLNKLYRRKDKVTDVLSFNNLENNEKILGEIIICAARAKKQAREFGNSLTEEFLRLSLHGYLHLCGYDHEKESDADVMLPLQEKILEKYV